MNCKKGLRPTKNFQENICLRYQKFKITQLPFRLFHRQTLLKYGSNVTVDLLLNDSDREELLKNYSANPPINTSRQLRAKALVKDKLNEDQISRLENIGFHTNEILEVLHL